MKLAYKNGITSVILRVKIIDSTTGNGKTGLTSASSGLIVSTIADNEATATVYTGSNLETITTLGTFAAPTSGKARFREVDATNHPGVYEVQIADARWSVSNARTVIISVLGVASTLQYDTEVQLSALPADTMLIEGSDATNVIDGRLVAFFGADWETAAAEVISQMQLIDIDGETFIEALRELTAVLLGKSIKVGNIRTYRDMADTKDRLVATTDADGQRTAVTRDGS